MNERKKEWLRTFNQMYLLSIFEGFRSSRDQKKILNQRELANYDGKTKQQPYESSQWPGRHRWKKAPLILCCDWLLCCQPQKTLLQTCGNLSVQFRGFWMVFLAPIKTVWGKQHLSISDPFTWCRASSAASESQTQQIRARLYHRYQLLVGTIFHFSNWDGRTKHLYC